LPLHSAKNFIPGKELLYKELEHNSKVSDFHCVNPAEKAETLLSQSPPLKLSPLYILLQENNPFS